MEIKKAFGVVREKVAAVLQNNGIEPVKEPKSDGEALRAVFAGAEQAYALLWDAEAKCFRLRHATVSDGEPNDDWAEVSCYLFDPDLSDDGDARSAANDFEDTLESRLKKKDLKPVPRKSKSDKMDLERFVCEFVEAYPQYEEALSAHIDRHGQLLPDTFIDENVAGHMMDLLKKEKNAFLKKLFEFFGKCYDQGDPDLRSAIMVTLFRHLLTDDKAGKFAEKYMSNTLSMSWRHMRPLLKKKADTLPR